MNALKLTSARRARGSIWGGSKASGRRRRLTRLSAVTALCLAAAPASSAFAGNLFATGHDLDFHCAFGAQCGYVKTAVNFVRAGAPDPTKPVLILDNHALEFPAALTHAYAPGSPPPSVVMDPSSAAFTTTPLTTSLYSAILIASDASCGGCDLNQAGTSDSDAINARTAAFAIFFNAGGGLLYASGAGHGSGGAGSIYYNSAPLPLGGVPVSPPFTLTTQGVGFGLTTTDANCCATHNSFTSPPTGSALTVAERDSAGAVETLFSSGTIIGGDIFTLTLAPPTETDPVGTAHSVTATLSDKSGVVAGKSVRFTVTGANPTTGTGTTNTAGQATFTYTGANAGTDTIKACGDLNSNGACDTAEPTATATKTWTTTTAPHDTQLAYTGPGTSDYDDPVTLSARLTDKTSPGPVTGQPVTFKLNGSESCTSTTNATGDASCSITPGEAAGTYLLAVTFGGSPGFKTSSTSVAFNVTKEQTKLVYTGDTHVANGTTATLSGVLTEDGTKPISGRPVKFSLGSQTCSGTTSVAGTASCTVTTSQPSGATTASITASFAGDGFYLPAAAATTARLTYMTGRAFGLAAHAAVLGLVGVTLLPTPDTGSISTSTAGSTATPCVATISGPVRANGLCANVTTTVGPGTSTATATVDNLGIAGLSHVPAITATAVAAHSTSKCSGASGQTTFASLTIGSAKYVNYNPAPNTTIVLPLGAGTIVLNEQLPVAGADHGMTVNAIHIKVPSDATDVVIASARSDIHNCA